MIYKAATVATASREAASREILSKQVVRNTKQVSSTALRLRQRCRSRIFQKYVRGFQQRTTKSSDTAV